jgi:hypothetical protein
VRKSKKYQSRMLLEPIGPAESGESLFESRLCFYMTKADVLWVSPISSVRFVQKS